MLADDDAGECVGAIEQFVPASEDADIHYGSAVTVLTPPERWAYAAQLPRDAYLGSLARGTVYVRMHVTEGEIEAGILTADGRTFLVERKVAAGVAPQTVSLPIARRGAGDLVIRNAADGGRRSKVVLYQVSAVASFQGFAHSAEF